MSKPQREDGSRLRKWAGTVVLKVTRLRVTRRNRAARARIFSLMASSSRSFSRGKTRVRGRHRHCAAVRSNTPLRSNTTHSRCASTLRSNTRCGCRSPSVCSVSGLLHTHCVGQCILTAWGGSVLAAPVLADHLCWRLQAARVESVLAVAPRSGPRPAAARSCPGRIRRARWRRGTLHLGRRRVSRRLVAWHRAERERWAATRAAACRGSAPLRRQGRAGGLG